MTFSARFIANVIQFALQQGASPKELLEPTSVTMAGLNDEQLRFDSAVYNAVIERAEEQTGDSLFGLHMGEYLSLSASGIIAQLVQTSRTIREALEQICAFANLGCRALPFELEEKKDHWELSVTPSPLWLEQSPTGVRHTVDGTLAFTHRQVKALTHRQHYPIAVHFSYERPVQVQEYERIFQTSVRFVQPTNALLLNKKMMQEAVVTSNYQLLQILVQHAQQQLQAIEQQEGFFKTVQQSIVNLVKPQFPTIEQVAANLNISVRTLQRRLKEEGYTFQNVLDNLRQQFALDYLKNKNLTISNIAYLLDYSELSAFSRSFKRWTGQSPQEYREQVF